jgi:transcriptional regulator with XRE-family HTH domain
MTPEQIKYFGDKVRFLRLRRGLSQTQLAAIIGIAPSVVGNWESGANGVTRTRLIKLSEKLNQPVSYFTGIDSGDSVIQPLPGIISDSVGKLLAKLSRLSPESRDKYLSAFSAMVDAQIFSEKPN